VRLFVVGAVTLVAGTARGDGELGLAVGELEARLVLERNITLRSQGRPTALAPDAWVGVAPRWTVGLVHSNVALGLVDTGASLCVKQDDYGCDRTYRGSGVDVRWSWRSGVLAVAPRGRLLARDVEPWKPALALGALVRWTRGPFSITGDPYLRFGLGNRDQGNRDAFVIPVWFAVQPIERWRLALHTGVDGEFATWSDGWHGPFAIATALDAARKPGWKIEVGLEIGFHSLLGPQNSYKERALSMWVGWRGQAW